MSILAYVFCLIGIGAAGIIGYILGYSSRRKWEKTIGGEDEI